MNSIENYIEKVKKETEGFTEEEMVRYVYMDLGKRLSFNLEFSFGNRKKKRDIYAESGKNSVNKSMETNIIICKSSAYILEVVLTALGIDIVTSVDSSDFRKCAHVFNIVRTKNARESYIIDLQTDLENIQSHMRTKEFGKSEQAGMLPIISRDELERIDRKIGYIKEDYYYADEYLELLKLNMSYFSDFKERVEFVLQNIDIYHNKEMKYAERKWHHETVMKALFTREELWKINLNDCYRETQKGKEYVTCITVDREKEGTTFYLFSIEDNHYQKISVKDLARQVKNGELVIVQMIPALRAFLREQEKGGRGE